MISASSPKVSMFGAKAGFVIPKNKLSGSLVPIFRGGSKGDSGSMGREDSTKQVQRKTKWGTDLTQDAAVRKGKILAYQVSPLPGTEVPFLVNSHTRMEQITQQLKSGLLKLDEDQGSESPEPSSVNSVTNHDDKSQKAELLELERRVLIGEILRLNPSYKAPPDYKPLLKESKVPIPIKSYSGYNFIGLLIGPESNTQKRLEEETGAKVRVYGIKSGLAEKREITKSDISEAQDVYEDLYVHVSADTYEKVDTAVALIELLLTPVSGIAGAAPVVSSSPAANNADLRTANQDSGFSPAPVTVPRPSSLPIRPGQPPFLLHPSPWFPTNVPPHPSSAFMPSFNPTQFPNLRVPPGAPQYFSRPHISLVPRTSSPPVMRPPLLVQLAPRQSSPVPIPQSVATLRSPGPHFEASYEFRSTSNSHLFQSTIYDFAYLFARAFPSWACSNFGNASFHPSILVPAPPRIQAPIPLRPPQSLPATPTSNSSTILSIVSSPVAAPKPLRPISGDFTFQPLRTQPPPASPNAMPGATVAPTPSFPAGATNIRLPPPMLPGYPRLTPAQAVAPAIPVSPPSFSRPPPQAPNPLRPPPAYPASFQPAHQNQMIHHLTRPGGSFTVPIQPMLGNAHSSIGGNQIYDPFSPTASSAAPHQGAIAAEVKKPETDSEYEDLMASVGVK
ncbi:hypothetical protein KSP39_PZI006562 [Platanthera zijinensis]|uniref:K Homology domain-containing protein n=1 Tax=Platanthera zijinensis TaxID=2320716 RepID=A0AAP0BSG2_9ASPA